MCYCPWHSEIHVSASHAISLPVSPPQRKDVGFWGGGLYACPSTTPLPTTPQPGMQTERSRNLDPPKLLLRSIASCPEHHGPGTATPSPRAAVGGKRQGSGQCRQSQAVALLSPCGHGPLTRGPGRAREASAGAGRRRPTALPHPATSRPGEGTWLESCPRPGEAPRGE